MYGFVTLKDLPDYPTLERRDNMASAGISVEVVTRANQALTAVRFRLHLGALRWGFGQARKC